MPPENSSFQTGKTASPPGLPPGRRYRAAPDPDELGDGGLVVVEDSDSFDRYLYRLSSVVYHGRTAYQNVLIGDSFNFGRMLVIDGAVQSAAYDEKLYHEFLVQPVLLRHPDPQTVLIIGGGEGAPLRETLMHSSVRSVTMVDLDRQVVELCREHLPAWHQGAFADPRTRLLFADGREFVAGAEESFDMAIIDVVDMLDNGPAQSLYTRQFYELLRRRLRPGGLVVVQGLEFSFLDHQEHTALARTLRTVFPQVHSYRVAIPSFLSSWGFLIASDWFSPAEWSAAEIDLVIDARLGDRLVHLTGDFLKACFTHCKETEFLLSLDGPILEDGVPFIAPPDLERTT